MVAACDSAADLPWVTRGAPSSPLRRKKASVLCASNYSFAAFSLQRKSYCCYRDCAHDRSRQSLDGTSTPSRHPRRLIPTVLLQHRSDLDPIWSKLVINRRKFYITLLHGLQEHDQMLPAD
jgi:hypothetical protein